VRSNPASLHEPSGFVNARFQPLRRLVRALKGEERLRGARAMRESTSCGGGSAIGVGARPASSIPQEAFQAARADRLGENNLEKKCHRPLTVPW
jgi:hypothetical protein